MHRSYDRHSGVGRGMFFTLDRRDSIYQARRLKNSIQRPGDRLNHPILHQTLRKLMLVPQRRVAVGHILFFGSLRSFDRVPVTCVDKILAHWLPRTKEWSRSIGCRKTTRIFGSFLFLNHHCDIICSTTIRRKIACLGAFDKEMHLPNTIITSQSSLTLWGARPAGSWPVRLATSRHSYQRQNLTQMNRSCQGSAGLCCAVDAFF